MSALSVAEQEALGRKIHELLVQRHPEVAGGASPELAPLRRQVESVLTALRGSHPPAVAGPDPRLFLLQTAELRSFSHPGASVYVSLALLDFAPDPAELEFVLARELSHLDRRHAAARIDAARGANAVEVDLVSEAYKQLVAGYTPEQEFEADVDAYRLLRSRGRTHRQTVSHLRRLVQREASKASEARPGAPSATARLARLDAMLDQ